MKKPFYFYLCFLVIFISCNPESSIFTVDKLPALVYQEPLPPFPKEMKKGNMRLNTRLLISEKGQVIDVEILSSGANREWDSLAVKKLKKWVFTPAILQNTPIKVWIKQPIRISIKEPLQMELAELVLENAEIAFEIFDSLEAGNNFHDMVRKYSISQSKKDSGYIGMVNIRELSPDQQNVLETLEPGKYSKPILFKGKYTIFKRIKHLN